MIDHVHALPQNYLLKEYRITGTLGFGGFGITYSALDTHLDKVIAIKEYLPSELAVRIDGSTVSAKSEKDKDDFSWGLERFLEEAKTVARFDHPNIVRIHRFFKSNGTGYIVMEFVEGETLSSLLKEKGTLEEAEIRQWLWPVMDGLKRVHDDGFLHRDIKPQNIMMRKDSRPVLLDFGAARVAMGNMTRTLTAIMTPGFAPLEQYETHGNQGPWTDIYALGAVIYGCISGRKPKDVLDRMRNPTLDSPETGSAKTYSSSLIRGVMAALCMEENDRPQNIEALLAILDAPDEDITIRMSIQRQAPSVEEVKFPHPPELELDSIQVQDEPRVESAPEKTQVQKPAEPLIEEHAGTGKEPWNFEVWFWDSIEALFNGKKLRSIFISFRSRVSSPGKYVKQWSAKKDLAKPKEKAPKQKKPKKELADILLAIGKWSILCVGIFAFYLFGKLLLQNEAAETKATETTLTPREIAERKQLAATAKAFTLVVDVKPEDAEIKVLNHDSPYSRGMTLPPGSYEIEISKPGYATRKQWIKIMSRDVQTSFSLEKE